jgi:hypothetical protein
MLRVESTVTGLTVIELLRWWQTALNARANSYLPEVHFYMVLPKSGHVVNSYE